MSSYFSIGDGWRNWVGGTGGGVVEVITKINFTVVRVATKSVHFVF
jgi:hypothetical protein